ncbi:protein EARLY RESPONSIVE TO DEHYDRATION 15 [Ricinus communis]|uniref:Protein EARLY RESPONSIVE TO DEHYDRATION 15 n=1 Tax=Ricinus communis TaxID=3988 RepID=B9SVS1_RICCO|nr:protein EARLY RESPONSIVE TO DEHYDRATION 15 [Ricinus communis]EEF32289.1 conserved hypothetical protein [Ricinus communis]|eukprot:XP_002530090.1 protein EARLY RESPONSIVE TO DEHYDRATION 15 [Ricinus communis]
MALVSGGRSTLNPDAPLFIPAAYRQVEDFSPEWWQLVTNSTWYRDYWLSQHQDEDGFYDNAEDDEGFDGNDVVDLLPETFDLDAGEYFSSLEAQFHEFVDSYETEVDGLEGAAAPKKDVTVSAAAAAKNVSLKCSP